MAICGINTLRNYSGGFVGHRHRLRGRQTTDGLLQMITYSFTRVTDVRFFTTDVVISHKRKNWFYAQFHLHISLCSRTPELARQNRLLLFNVINFITALPAVTPTCPLFGMFVHVFSMSDFIVGNFVTLPSVLSVRRPHSAANIKVE